MSVNKPPAQMPEGKDLGLPNPLGPLGQSISQGARGLYKKEYPKSPRGSSLKMQDINQTPLHYSHSHSAQKCLSTQQTNFRLPH